MTRDRAPRRRLLRVVERAILGAGMTVAAFVVERRLLKALRKGGTPRPQPFAEPDTGPHLTATATEAPHTKRR